MIFLDKSGHGLSRHKIQYAAMVDCVFLLLIFFVAVARVRTPEGDLPTWNCQDGKGDVEPIRVWVADSEAGPVVRLGGALGEGLTGFPALASRLSEMAGENVIVVVGGPPDVRLETVTGALDASLEAGITTLRIDVPVSGPLKSNLSSRAERLKQ